MNYKNKICKTIFISYLIVISLLTTAKSMIFNDFDENHTKCYLTHLPKELSLKVSSFLEFKELLRLRQTSKALKGTVDSDYNRRYKVSIRAKTSLPTIEEIKNIPFANVSLSFERWEQKDIEELLHFKQATHLHLEGLQSWDFSTGALFNPSLYSYFSSCITSIANYAFHALFRMDLSYTPAIFLNVTSLDLSNSTIGDYGVKCFVSHFKNLKFLNISTNNIGHNTIGEADVIFNNKVLTSLNVSKNHFSNHSIEQMTKLKNLTFLDISYNLISDDNVIKTLSQLPKLQSFIHKEQMSTHGKQGYQ